MSFLNNLSNKAGSAVSSKLGSTINSITGNSNFPSEDIPTYEKFLYSILSDADNAITESSYWVVFFSPSPDYSGLPATKSTIKGLIRNAFSSNGIDLGYNGTNSKEENNLEVHSWKTSEKSKDSLKAFWNDIESTIMLVQGIEIPGDGFSVSRQGADNIGGFLRPLIGGIRNDMPEMEITFLENNSSVTDLVLRPWVINSTYASLKFANKAVITCHNLTRSPSGWRVRKTFKFYNAVPISIDAEKYDYTAATTYGKRQCKFTFTDYSIDDGNAMKDGLMGSISNFALQKTRNFISGVAESGVDMLAGGANQVYTNIKGSFVDTVNDHLQDVQSRVRDFGMNAEESIIDKSQRFIDKSIGFNPEKDSIMRGGEDFPKSGVENNPSPRKNITVRNNDTLASPPVPPKSTGVKNSAKYTLIAINSDDTPDTQSLNLQERGINSSSEDIEMNKTSINENDTIRR